MRSHALRRGQLLPEFLATRGLAAVWIVIAHATMMTLDKGDGVIAYSRVIVDFFFVQSGFVLAHVYDAAWREGRFRYRTFLARRLMRIWPLHVATLFGMAVLIFVGVMAGMAPPKNDHGLWSFAATFLMLHAAWTTTGLAWNWPSWSVGAEWCAYLMTPVYFLAADQLRGGLARVAAVLSLFVVGVGIAHEAIGEDLVGLTSNGGALRLAPSFLAGILLRRAYDDMPALLAIGSRLRILATAGVIAVGVAVIAVGASADGLWPGAVVSIAVLASREASGATGPLHGRFFAWLGELSYALYLVHAPVIMAAFAAAGFLGHDQSLAERCTVAAIGCVLALAIAQGVHLLVEKPGRTAMARLLLREREPASASA